MRLRLIPRDAGFYALYCSQASLAAEATTILEADLRDFADPVGAANRIREIRRQGEDLRHEIVLRLGRTFVPPFGPNEVLALAATLDDVLDLVEETADKLALYHLARPPKGAADQAKLLRRACDVIVAAVDRLDRPSDLCQYSARIHAIEKEAHAIFRRHIRRLFDGGNDVRSVLIGKDIYRGLETAADRADAVGRVLDGIALGAVPGPAW
jgi:uncharacterized protein Yka (UPF0111/DUF47 family)